MTDTNNASVDVIRLSKTVRLWHGRAWPASIAVRKAGHHAMAMSSSGDATGRGSEAKSTWESYALTIVECGRACEEG